MLRLDFLIYMRNMNINIEIVTYRNSMRMITRVHKQRVVMFLRLLPR